MQSIVQRGNLHGQLARCRRLLVCSAHRGHPVVYHPDFQISPLPEGHRFPMPKDHLLYLTLKERGLADNLFIPSYPDASTIGLAHCSDYVEEFISGSIDQTKLRQIGLPWSAELVKRTLIGCGSAILAARLALQYGVACMTNGGTHHAHWDHGSGWCIFNDLAVAARAVQRDAGIGKIIIVDLDVHQGDGTAAIFQDDPSVFTLSLHCVQQSFPRQLQRSDLDVPIPAGCTDDEYLQVLDEVLPAVLREVRPQLVLYNAGVDVAAGDALGLLALSQRGIAARDATVMRQCAAAGAPVAAAIGGGYSPDHGQIVERHVLLHAAAAVHLSELSAVVWRR